MKKISIIHNIILIISIVLFILSVIISPYSFSYLSALVFSILLALFTFSTGLIVNEKEFYQRNIIKYYILYFVLLILLTMFINRTGASILEKKLLDNYIHTINIIPFKTIIDYLVGTANLSIKITNIIGNLIAFIPLSFLLILKDKKYSQIKYQALYLGITVLLIELLQLITSTGRFDIDDFILNIGGALLFVFLLNRLNSLNKIKNIFYRDFHLPKVIKYIIWWTTMIFIILTDIMVISNITMIKPVIQQNFYVEEKENCTESKRINMKDYNLYLNCVDVIYETEDHYQIPLEEALKTQKLNKSQIRKELPLDLKDGATSIHRSKDENITIILCNTKDGNKDIYIGNKNMKYNKNFCK